MFYFFGVFLQKRLQLYLFFWGQARMVRGTGMKNIQRFHPEACRHMKEPSTVVRLPLLLLNLLSACAAATARNPQVCVHRDTARRDWGPWLCHGISLKNSLSYRHQWGRGEVDQQAGCGVDETDDLVWSSLGSKQHTQYMSQCFLPAVPSSVPGTQDVSNKCLLKECV